MAFVTTKRIISDQVLFRLNGGWPSISFKIQKEDIWKATEQKVNTIFKTEQFSINLPSGETIPDGLMVATYEDVSVERSGAGRSKSTLPVIPISLPKNAGIQMIYPIINTTDSGDKTYGNPLIPLVQGQQELLQTDSLLNDLLGRFGYTPNGATIFYTKDLTTFGISKVDMKLVVFDISSTTEDDVLPIPKDYEERIVNELVEQFAPTPASSGLVNKTTTPETSPK